MTARKNASLEQRRATHRPGCQRPGWTVERSSSIRGVSIARCIGCQAVELRTEATR